MRIIKGEHIYLKLLKVEEVTDDYVNWLNDSTINQYLESRFVRYTKESVKAYVKSFYGTKDKMLWGIFLVNNNLHVGNISFSEIKWNHRIGVVGIALGRRECFGKGYATEALQLIIEYAFKTLGLRRLEAGMYANNKASLNLFKKLGFKQEANLRKRYKYNAKYVDGLIVGLLKEDKQ